MGLSVYNTFTAKKEDFVPVSESRVKLYVCGVTVYDHCHIGHARSAIVFDVIYRYLVAKGYDATFVKNFTDIDDKIIKKSQLEGIPWRELGEKYIGSFYEDMDALGILRPSHEPRATEHIEDMIAVIETLLRKGNAYRAEGDVYFSVDSYKGYGELSKRSLEDMVAGARIEVNDKKRNPLDFALWKASKQGEPSWAAPFGDGRPGWHIECSVMSAKYLGAPFDIHGGGKDLIFPHHENERAQAESAAGTTFAKYWLHNGFVNVEKEKMSKSLGNIRLIKDFVRDYHAEVLRLFFLSTHYRNPIDYTEQSVEDTNTALRRLYYALERVSEIRKEKGLAPQRFAQAEALEKGFYEAMDDDFNSALALSSLFELSKTINKMLDDRDETAAPFIVDAGDRLLALANVLGLLRDDLNAFAMSEKGRHLSRVGLDMSVLENAIQDRVEARKSKDFKRADEIREMLLGKGILLQDSPKGTGWRIKPVNAAKGEG
jgi:cysteinyl-tRNA synthetase